MPIHPETKDHVGTWTPSKGNEEVALSWPWPCPCCEHGREDHCEPYQPFAFADTDGTAHGERHSRCSRNVNEGKTDQKGNPLPYRACGTCRMTF